MPVVQAGADAEAAIARARSLFGSSTSITVPDSGADVTEAAQTAAAGRDRTLDMAGGAGLPSYRDMVNRSIPPLTSAAASDAGLTAHLVTAAAVTDAGATQLDGIADHTRTICAAAPAARTAADQRAVLTALRGQLQQASQVVQTTQQQAGAAATQIDALHYPNDAPAFAGGAQGLQDPIVDGQPAGTPLVEAVGFGLGGAALDPAPAVTSGGSSPQPFLPTWQQSLAAPPAPPQPGPAVGLPAGGSPPPPPLPFGDCFHNHMVPGLGEHMVSDGFEGGLTGALSGATGGAALTPEAGGFGALPGSVLGFVGGFAKGAFEAPIKAAGKSAADCVIEEAGQ
jgi:hypothetical protein